MGYDDENDDDIEASCYWVQSCVIPGTAGVVIAWFFAFISFCFLLCGCLAKTSGSSQKGIMELFLPVLVGLPCLIFFFWPGVFATLLISCVLVWLFNTCTAWLFKKCKKCTDNTSNNASKYENTNTSNNASNTSNSASNKV